MEGNRNAAQRLDVASIMEELTDFVCLMPRSSVLRVELDAALAQLIGTPHRFENGRLLSWGVLQTFGRRGGLSVHSVEGNITAKTRQTWPGGPAAFDAWSREADLQLTRAVLRGPTEEGVEDMRARGWDPAVARRIAEDRAGSERELVARLDAEPSYRRDRVRDVVSARYLA